MPSLARQYPCPGILPNDLDCGALLPFSAQWESPATSSHGPLSRGGWLIEDLAKRCPRCGLPTDETKALDHI